MDKTCNETDVVATWHLLTTPTIPHVRWASRKGDRMEGGVAFNPMELVAYVEAFPGWDFYVQPNPSRKTWGTRCSADEVTYWRFFLIDLDPLSTWRVGDAHEATMEAMRHVTSFMDGYAGRALYAILLDSGRGHQLWYPLGLHDPDAFDWRLTIPRAQAYWLERLGARLASVVPGVTVDPAVSDLPRLMRCPGTVNTKTGRLASLYNSGTLDNPSLVSQIINYTPKDRLVPPETHVTVPAPADRTWHSVLHEIGPTAADYLTMGESEPRRHRAAIATARALAERGISYDQIVVALIAGGFKCNPTLLDMGYFERTAREAWKRVNRG